MKRTIRLRESELKQMISESVRRVLNEIDYSKIPTGDFYERNNWWKQQLDNDFPNHGVDKSNNWQNDYYKFANDKEEKDKASLKAQKAKEREENRLRRREEAKRLKAIERENHKVTRMKYGEDQLVVELDKEEIRVFWALLDKYKEPQNGGQFDVELYEDGTWLPYEETYGPGRKMPSQLKPYLMKMFKKLGMRDSEE